MSVMGAEELPMRTRRSLGFNVSCPYVVQFLGNEITLGQGASQRHKGDDHTGYFENCHFNKDCSSRTFLRFKRLQSSVQSVILL